MSSLVQRCKCECACPHRLRYTKYNNGRCRECREALIHARKLHNQHCLNDDALLSIPEDGAYNMVQACGIESCGHDECQKLVCEKHDYQWLDELFETCSNCGDEKQLDDVRLAQRKRYGIQFQPADSAKEGE